MALPDWAASYHWRESCATSVYHLTSVSDRPLKPLCLSHPNIQLRCRSDATCIVHTTVSIPRSSVPVLKYFLSFEYARNLPFSSWPLPSSPEHGALLPWRFQLPPPSDVGAAVAANQQHLARLISVFYLGYQSLYPPNAHWSAESRSIDQTRWVCLGMVTTDHTLFFLSFFSFFICFHLWFCIFHL